MSAVMLFFIGDMRVFVPLYIVAGITDVADGFIARKFNARTALGARLDSAGDAVMFLVIVYYLLRIETDILSPYWIAIAIILSVKIISVVAGAIRFRKPIVLHTLANKTAGVAVWLLPLMLWLGLSWYIIPVIIIAAGAAIEEAAMVIYSKGEIEPNRKSIFCR